MTATINTAQTIIYEPVFCDGVPNETTRRVMEETDKGINIIGPFNSAFDFWDSLEENDAWEDL